MGLGKIAKIGAAPATGGASLLSKSSLFGKVEDPGGLPEEIKDLRNRSSALQTDVLLRLDKETDPRNIAGVIQGRLQREAAVQRGGTEDALRQLRQRIAQRGMGRSSLGIVAETGLRRDLSTNLSRIRASAPDLIRQERLARIDALMNAARGGAASSSLFAPAPRRVRQGLIAPLMTVAGGAAGAALGGPAGASAGSQIGAGVGSGLQGAFGPG